MGGGVSFGWDFLAAMSMCLDFCKGLNTGTGGEVLVSRKLGSLNQE